MKKILASLLTVAMIATLVPFAAFAEETVDTSFVFGTGSYGSFRSQGIPGVQIGGIGGKAQDDLSMAFVVDSDFNGQESRWEYPTTHISADDIGSGGTKGMYCSFNMYADGDTVVGVGYASNLSAILKWEADGTLTYNIEKVNHTIMLERGKWHKVVISVCEGVGQRVGLFIDGVLLSTTSDPGWSGWASKTPFLFGVPQTCGTGTVAFDDPYLTLWTDYNTYGKTMKANDVAIAANTDSLTFDTEAKTISLNHYPESYDAFVASVAEGFTNETEIRILTEDMSAVATTVEDAKIALVKTINNAYDYYTFNEYVKTDMEKVGLEASGNVNIIVNDDNVVVMSNPYVGAGMITSANVINALSSSENFTLAYVNADKEEVAVNHVTSGYIKATKDGEDTIYIPIISEMPGSRVSDLIYNQGHGSSDIATIVNEEQTVAGVTTNVQGFITKETVGSRRIQFNPTSYDATSKTTNITFTYVFNMYADGNADAWVGYGSGYPLFKWDANGDVYTVSESSALAYDTTAVMNIQRNRWHQISVTVDKKRNRPIIHIDGKLLKPSYSDDFPYSGIHYLALCVTGKEVANDKVLYSDVTYYEGFYTKGNEFVESVSPATDFAIDMDNNIIYYQNIGVQELKDLILANTNASTAMVYADNTFASEATTLDNNSNVVVLTSPNGFRYEYYTLKDYSEIPAPEFAFDLGETTFTVSAKIKADYTGSTIYVATYTSDNTLVAVTPIALDASDYNTEFSQKFAYGGGGRKIKVFLWDGEQNPVSFAEADRPAE